MSDIPVGITRFDGADAAAGGTPRPFAKAFLDRYPRSMARWYQVVLSHNLKRLSRILYQF